MKKAPVLANISSIVYPIRFVMIQNGSDYNGVYFIGVNLKLFVILMIVVSKQKDDIE